MISNVCIAVLVMIVLEVVLLQGHLKQEAIKAI